MSSTKNKKRKSQAPVAFVYFLTMLVFLGTLGMLSMYILKRCNVIGDNSSSSDVKTQSVAFNNLYARVNSKGILCDATVIRIAPESKKVIIVPISAFSADSQSNKTFRELYADGGITRLKKAVKDNYGLDTDSYASITNSAFEDCADIFGGFSYSPPEELYYLSKDNANDISLEKGQLTNLTGRQIRLICSYPVFSEGKQGNTEFLGTALKELLNNAFRQSQITTDNLDNLYDIITANSDTDLSKDTYKLQKSYIKDMLQENLSPAETMVAEGTWTDTSHFKVSDDFVKSLEKMMTETAPVVEVSSTEQAD